MNTALQELANVTEAGGSYSINWQPQRAYYQTVTEYIGDDSLPDVVFENEEQKWLAISSNNLVTLQWYPCTPIGFHLFGAPDLESLMRWAPWIEIADAKVRQTVTGLRRAGVTICKVCDLPMAAVESYVAENGGNPDFCWSGCPGYTHRRPPRFFDGGSLDVDFECGKCGEQITYRGSDGDSSSIGEMLEAVGMKVIDGEARCKNGCEND